MNAETLRWIELDRQHCWHPFTRQDDWCSPDFEPLVIVKGEGVWLQDTEKRRYLDGNSSIWTNIHGHGHPALVTAAVEQLHVLQHTSFLGTTHPWAIELAKKLTGFFPEESLERVFFSDNGSTAVEVALKMSVQYHQQVGQAQKCEFVAFANGYHGDTLGAASLGGVGRFFERFKGCGYTVHSVASLKELDALASESIAGIVIEPIIQGVNEMRPWPPGMLRKLRQWCDLHHVQLILDEVMTGFGRTGAMFACQLEAVIPDFLCLAKGISGGFMPLAATLTTAEVYQAFLDGAERAFYYGHSYTANPLACAIAIANLELFETEQTLSRIPALATHLSQLLSNLKDQHPMIYEIRQVGLIAGIELRDPAGKKFPLDQRIGEQVCHAARAHGLLTRPILDTIVIMPPLAITSNELDLIAHALDAAIASVISNNQGIDISAPVS